MSVGVGVSESVSAGSAGVSVGARGVDLEHEI